MRNEERDYTWTRPGMRACVEKRLRDFIVRPDGGLFDDDEVISTLKKQLVYGLLSHHVIAEGFNNVGCLQRDSETEGYNGIGDGIGSGGFRLFIAILLLGEYFITKQVVNDSVGEDRIDSAFIYVPYAVVCIIPATLQALVLTSIISCCYDKSHSAFYHITTTVDTESQACDVLRERLWALAEHESTEGNAAVAKQVRRLAESDFSSFSDIHFTSSTPVLVKGAMTHGASAAETQQQGGGGGGEKGESEPLLPRQDVLGKEGTSSESSRGCRIC